MPVTYTVLYPKGSIFDVDYYATKHMPMALELLPGSLLGYEVYRFPDDAPFAIQCDTEFVSDDAFANWKNTEGGKKLLDDLKTFSTEAPVIMRRKHIASSS